MENTPTLWAKGGADMEDKKKISAAQQKAVNKYVKENYDRINVNMPKGRKEAVKAHAETQGESLNAFINRAITETMERDKGSTETPNG